MTSTVTLRPVTLDDLPIFYGQQREPEANAMAMFPPREENAFMTHWHKILRDDTGIIRTILYNDAVAGNIVCWQGGSDHMVGYWLGKEFWGMGIASHALAQFLALIPHRPLAAYVVKNNLGSQRVLEKNGFQKVGVQLIVDDAITDEIEEYIYHLK